LRTLRGIASFTFLFGLQAHAIMPASDSYMDLLVRRPDIRINWSSPRSTFVSILKEKVAGGAGWVLRSERLRSFSPYGHGSMRLHCSPDGDPARIREEWFGYSGDGNGIGARLVSKEKVGYEILFHPFPDGELDTNPESVKAEFRGALRDPKHPPRMLRVALDPERCRKAIDHLERFRALPTKIYGFAQDPLKYEGASCASLVASFLKVTGLYEPIYDLWVRTVEISDRSGEASRAIRSSTRSRTRAARAGSASVR
jgi:hypothetical protein